MKVFIVFPNTLYECIHEAMKEADCIYLVEEPLFFYDVKLRHFKYHKLKIAYMRACMKCYYDYLSNQRFLNKTAIKYIDYDDVKEYGFFKDVHNATTFFPVDITLTQKYKHIANDRGFTIEFIQDLPNFIASTSELETYSKRKSYSHKTFYDTMKNKLDILNGWANYDKENRQAIPGDVSPPPIQLYKNHHYEDAVKYVITHGQFSKHVGECNLDVLRQYPITLQDAKKHLKLFLKSRLHDFGKYQDAISSNDVFLWHGNISCVLNNGLLKPHDVIKAAIDHAKLSEIPPNSLEGFIRQVIGWREYMRFIYLFGANETTLPNHWKATRSLNWDVWYGRVPCVIEPLNNEIKKCLHNGYAHHIVRLMFFLNVFVMCCVKPEDIVQWFMEVCSIDAYPWVMYSNICSMGWYDTRFMKKPYISTSNYILKMSNYKKGNWTKIWDCLFYGFLKQNEDLLLSTSRIYLMNVNHFKRFAAQKKKEILTSYKDILSHLTPKP